MAKYSEDLKLKVIREYLSGEGGYTFLARKHNINDKSTVRKWVKYYEHFGAEGLKRKEYPSYTVQFKMDVINYKIRTGESNFHVALAYGLSEPSLISQWLSVWRTEGSEALSKKRGRPKLKPDKPKKNISSERTIKELEEENELLRIENAYLKELRALGINIPSRLLKQKPESSKRSDIDFD